MDTLSGKKEISKLINTIKEASDAMDKATAFSRDEVEGLIKMVEELNKKCHVLEYLNANPTATEKPIIITPEPVVTVPEPIINPVAEVEIISEEPVVETAPTPEVTPDKEEIVEKVEAGNAPLKSASLKKITIGINDKFQFIKELFSGNGAEYEKAINKLNTLENLTAAENYFNSLAESNNWDEEAETVIRLKEMINGRFS